MTTIVRRNAILILAILCLFVGRPTPASAHARLVESQPLSGNALPTMPTNLLLRFSEAVVPASVSLALTDESGIDIVLTDPKFTEDDHVVQTSVDPITAALGTFQLRWSVTSASDGHDSAGVVTFTVGTGRAPATFAISGDSRDAWWQILTRAIWLLALALLAGCLLTRLGFNRQPNRRLTVVAGAAGLMAATLLAAPWSEIRWETTSARLQLLAGGFGLLAALVASSQRRAMSTLAFFPWAASVLCLSASGHAAGVSQPVLTTAILTVHAALALLWLGSLAALLVLGDAMAQSRWLRWHSRTALGGVLVLAAAGLVYVPFQITGERGITDSTYGRTLLLKTAIVLLALAMAATNRLIVRPLVVASPANRLPRQARITMVAELAALSIVVCLAAALSSTAPPAKQMITQVASPIRNVDHTIATDDVIMHMTATITGTVDDRFRIAIQQTGAPAEIQRVIVSTSYIDPQTREIVPGERLDADQVRDAPGVYQFSALRLSRQAEWTLTVTVRRYRLLDATADFTVDTSAWQAAPPIVSDRTWRRPVVPASGWMLLAVAVLVPVIGMGIIRRNGQVAPLSGAILIVALTMITTGFSIQAWQRTSARTAGHDLTTSTDPDLVSARANYDALCLACHGPVATGTANTDPLHQHGSGTNLVDARSRRLSDGDLYTQLTSGIGDTDMPAYRLALTDSERWDLVAYLRRLQADAPESEFDP